MQAVRWIPVAGLAALAIASVFGGPAHAVTPPDPLLQRLVFEHRNARPVSNVSNVEPGVLTRSIKYGASHGKPISGYLARPNSERDTPTPALVVVHEWWGLNDNIRAMTRRLAASGYTALAVDLYGGETAQKPEQARALMEEAMNNQERLKRNLRQAVLYLDLMPSTDRVGSLGWCFGGGWSLRAALMFPELLDSAVMYYGELVTERQRLERLAAPLLGHFGAEDTSIPTERVRRFDELLSELDKPHEIYIYENAGHAFANPSGTRYAQESAELAWQRTINFLGETLKGQSQSRSQ